MNRSLKATALAVVLALGLSACATTVDPDFVGLYYAQGQSDGNHFDHCVDPGTSETEWNNSIIFLPRSVRAWNIAPNSNDQKNPITVASKPQEGQPSGVQVNVWAIANMTLNTDCGKDNKGGVVNQFWESIGRRYKADTTEGWKNMMEVTVVPALTTAIRNTSRGYTADDLVANKDGILNEVQQQVSVLFASELERLAGGKYFCGPDFKGSGACTPVQISVVDVDYSDPGIQDARNNKQKALEQAAAQLAEAQGTANAKIAAAEGDVKAANAVRSLYNNPAWVKLQLAQKQLEVAQACAASPKCTMVMDASGNLQIHAS